MTPDELAEVNEALNSVTLRLKIRQLSPMYWSLNPSSVIDNIVDTVEAEFANWERVFDLAVEDMLSWRKKSEVYRQQRNHLFHLLKLALQSGVITDDDQSDLLRTMEFSCGSDASNVAKPSLES